VKNHAPNGIKIMSLLDRAFVKAYARTLASTPSRPSSPYLPVNHIVVDTLTQTEIEPASSGLVSPALQWNELPEESYFRVDVGHSQAIRRSPAVDPVTAVATDTPVTPVARHEETPAAPLEMRIDPPHFQCEWKPPVVIETEDVVRFRRNQEEAAEFARAKSVAMGQMGTAAIQAAPVQAATAAESIRETRSLETAPSIVAVRPFEPVWEVDAFEFVDTIVALFGDAKLMKSIGAPLDHAVANGLRSILITSAERGVGRTSVAVGIAVSAAAAGLRVALVDVDVNQSGLAEALRIEVQQDWVEAGRTGMPLDEVAVRSIEDQFTVLPIVAGQSKRRCASSELDRMMAQLHDVFDLIIIDGAPWFDNAVPLPHSNSIDAAIIVVDDRKRDDNVVAQIQSDLRASGVAGLGIVENFT